MLEIRRPSTNQPQRMVLGELEQNSNMILVRPSTNHTEAAEAKFISKKIVDYDRERTAAGRQIKKTKEEIALNLNVSNINSSIQPIKIETHTLSLSNRVPFGYIHRFKVVQQSGTYILKNQANQPLSVASKKWKVFGSQFLFDTPFVHQRHMHGLLQGNFSGSIFQFGENSQNKSNLCIKYKNSCRIQPRNTRAVCVFMTDDQGKTLHFYGKQPVWCPKRNKFIMKMGGRAKLASTSNCILVNDLTNQDTLLIGKEDQNTYNLDVRHPFSPMQAFAIAVSSLCFKLSVQ